jgi:hypothetical protein
VERNGRRKRRPKTKHTWILTLAVALVGASATIVAAFIARPGGPKPVPHHGESQLAITSVAVHREPPTQAVVVVEGTARNLRTGDEVYAIARVPNVSATNATAPALRTSQWSVSSGTAPDKQGRWRDEITLPLPVAETRTVTYQAAEAPAPIEIECPKGEVCAAPPQEVARRELETGGPAAARAISRPFTSEQPFPPRGGSLQRAAP